MTRSLRLMAVFAGVAYTIVTAAENMASPEESGWQAAEGSGCLVWNPNPQAEETVTWSGPCEGNRASGQGELVWRSPGKTDRYVGEMRDGKRNGRGTAVSPGGDRYEGEWLEGLFQGRGFAVSMRGDRYEGEWIAGRLQGLGTYRSKEGDRYEGEFVGGKRARGKMTRKNGDWYDGQWRGGLPDGKGEAKINGQAYKGRWARGCLQGTQQRVAWGGTPHECPLGDAD